MNTPAPVAPPRATYQDVLDAPEGMIAEILDGALRLQPRPAARHQFAVSRLTVALQGPFDLGTGGPGGWWFACEPELHLGGDVLAPDLAGWRRDRMPAFPDTPAVRQAPDWICEVSSPSTRVYDRTAKRDRYAWRGVEFLWMVSTEARTLEAFALRDGRWTLTGAFGPGDRVAAAPFSEVPFPLDLLWPDAAPPAETPA
jgi:Uma2 family endonuclease